jgi:hypothetical protein
MSLSGNNRIISQLQATKAPAHVPPTFPSTLCIEYPDGMINFDGIASHSGINQQNKKRCHVSGKIMGSTPNYFVNGSALFDFNQF